MRTVFEPDASGRQPVGPAEGLLMSDIRLHIALATRRKNPTSFRPDLFSEVKLEREHLERLPTSQAFARLRFVADPPLGDMRHLQLLPHLARCVCELGNGGLVYDLMRQEMFLPEDFAAMLSDNPDCTGPQVHTRLSWIHEGEVCRMIAFGLGKLGLPDLWTHPAACDLEVLLREVMQAAVIEIWSQRAMPEILAVEAFDDRFELDLVREGARTTAQVRRFEPS